MRILSSRLTLEAIFNDRQAFKETIIDNIQQELNQLGLRIYNANIKELQDYGDSKYFHNMRQKKLAEAEYTAVIDIATAKKAGDIGQKEKETETRQIIANLEAATVKTENEAKEKIAVSKSQLSVIESQAIQTINIAKIEADNNSKIKDAEMQEKLEQQRIKMEIEKGRSTDVTKTQIANEKIRIMADAEFYKKQTEANADLYKKQTDADAIKILADATLCSMIKEADGNLANLNAQANGLQQLINSFGGDKSLLAQYLMIKEKTFIDLANANAQALQNLNPKITLWNTGQSDKSTENLTNILKMLPPLLTTIHDQTGIKLPDTILEIPKPEKKTLIE